MQKNMQSSRNIVIIKYNAGNIRSVDFALKRMGVSALVSDDPEMIRNASMVIFPGVGEAAGTMEYLRRRGLDEVILHLTQPVLGICLGMQLMCKYSEEGPTDCLGIFDTGVVKFQQGKVPHMGWNALDMANGTLFKNIGKASYVYFVHSYYVPLNKYTCATSYYGTTFSASMQKDNFFATQFHPEKSGGIGEKILRNFIGS
jgi:imidazole glycerol-phosphate synthase subunit HisH